MSFHPDRNRAAKPAILRLEALEERCNPITFVSPDIAVLSARLVIPTTTVEFTYRTKDLQRTGHEQFEMALYRSSDEIFDEESDKLLATSSVGASITNEEIVGTFTLPDNLSRDRTRPFLLVVADPADKIKETDEKNNTQVVGFQKPDIALQSAWLTSTGEVQFPYQTTGNLTSFRVGLYRSADANYDLSDVLVTTQDIISSQEGVGSISASWPGDPAKPYLLVVADPWTSDKPDGLLLEQDDRGNNVAFVRPVSVELLAHYLVNTFPGIVVTDIGVRSIAKQAEYMLEGALRQTRYEFVEETYGGGWYAKSMYDYLEQEAYAGGPSRMTVLKPRAPYPEKVVASVRAETLTKFENLILEARKGGANVSDHLDGTAVDIRVPPEAYKQPIEGLLSAWKAVLIKLDHGTAPHWHISYEYWPKNKK